MNCEQSMVREFHKTFDIPVLDKPETQPESVIYRRINLMVEELLELRTAMWSGNLIAIADGIADLLYVVYGTALEFGLDMEPIFAEVHRSNMTKVGGTKRDDGKWLKPEDYSPPDLTPIINKQIAAGIILEVEDPKDLLNAIEDYMKSIK